MAGTLESVGYICAEDASEADVVVYNTCSIRDKAEQKVYSALGKQVCCQSPVICAPTCVDPENRLVPYSPSMVLIPKCTVQAKRKRSNMGGLKLVLAGCVAAQEGETLLRRVPELDLVMGPHHANRCPL